MKKSKCVQPERRQEGKEKICIGKYEAQPSATQHLINEVNKRLGVWEEREIIEIGGILFRSNKVIS